MKKTNLQPELITPSGQIIQPHTNTIYEFFQILFLFAGILLSLHDLMYSSNCLILALVSGSIVLILRFVSQFSDTWGKRVDLSLYILGIAALVLSNFSLVQAILDVCNRIMILCNLRFETDFSKFAVKSSAAFGSLILWLVLGAFLTSVFYRQVKRRQLQRSFLILMICLAFGFVFENSWMLPAVFFTLLGIFCIFIYACTPKRKFGIQFWGSHLGFLILAIVLVFTCSGYQSLSSIESVKTSISDKIEEIRYGKDTLPKGDLTKASNLLSGKKERLDIEIDHPQELYLKGFVGGSYEKDHWSVLTADHYEDSYEGILTWLSKQKFDPVTQYQTYQTLSLPNDTDLNLTKVTVKNTGAYRKYVYLPNTMSAFTAFRAGSKKDWNIQSSRFFGTSDYKFQTFYYSQDLTFETVRSWMKNPTSAKQKNYIQAESVYAQFVKDSYLDIDSSLKKELNNLFFKDMKKMDFNETTTRIRQMLRQTIRYTEHPKEDASAGNNYISWLLHDSKEGNSVSYATVAVMAYRACGYPARYVEGYHLSNDEASKMTKEQKKDVILTTQNAHAWVEIYRSGLGWIPVEVVPGMYTETYSTQTVQGKPSYQLKSKKDKSGINTERGKSGNQQKKEKKDKEAFAPVIVKKVVTTMIILCYIFLIIYLILELQRKIRLSYREKNIHEPMSVNELTKTLGMLWKLSKIQGDDSHPLHLESEILAVYPQIQPMEYERVISLIQKSRFGGKTLRPHEQHTLICFVDKISHLLWKKSSIFGKILLRYVYLIPNNL